MYTPFFVYKHNKGNAITLLCIVGFFSVKREDFNDDVLERSLSTHNNSIGASTFSVDVSQGGNLVRIVTELGEWMGNVCVWMQVLFWIKVCMDCASGDVHDSAREELSDGRG